MSVKLKWSSGRTKNHDLQWSDSGLIFSKRSITGTGTRGSVPVIDGVFNRQYRPDGHANDSTNNDFISALLWYII